MLTQAQITAGAARLVSSKLTNVDIDGVVSVMRMFFGDLEQKYGYNWKTGLTALTDDGNDLEECAQIGACINQMETLGFGVASLQGGRDALFYKEKDEYWQYVVIIHTKLYPLPIELSNYSLARAGFSKAKSGTIQSTRPELGGSGFWSERSRRWRGL